VARPVTTTTAASATRLRRSSSSLPMAPPRPSAASVPACPSLPSRPRLPTELPLVEASAASVPFPFPGATKREARAPCAAAACPPPPLALPRFLAFPLGWLARVAAAACWFLSLSLSFWRGDMDSVYFYGVGRQQGDGGLRGRHVGPLQAAVHQQGAVRS
jgi:hypothetical protein